MRRDPHGRDSKAFCRDNGIHDDAETYYYTRMLLMLMFWASCLLQKLLGEKWMSVSAQLGTASVMTTMHARMCVMLVLATMINSSVCVYELF